MIWSKYAITNLKPGYVSFSGLTTNMCVRILYPAQTYTCFLIISNVRSKTKNPSLLHLINTISLSFSISKRISGWSKNEKHKKSFCAFSYVSDSTSITRLNGNSLFTQRARKLKNIVQSDRYKREVFSNCCNMDWIYV